MTDVLVDTTKDILLDESDNSTNLIVEEATNLLVTNDPNILVVSDDSPYIVESVTQGPPGPPGPVGDEELPYDKLIDEINSEGDLYVGEADPGTLETQAAWRIYLLDITGGDASKRYANGSAAFDKVWTDRAMYTY